MSIFDSPNPWHPNRAVLRRVYASANVPGGDYGGREAPASAASALDERGGETRVGVDSRTQSVPGGQWRSRRGHLPLQEVVRPTLTTREAAFYLNRSEHTLYVWAMHERGPLVPLRVHGRLAWPTAAIRDLLEPRK